MIKVMLVSFFTNALLVVIKLLVGFVGNSSALIADGFHSLSDLMSDIIAILGGFLSNKKEDIEHPFGHGKFDYIISTVIGILIILLGFNLIYGIYDSEIVIPSTFVLIFIVITIILKLLLSCYLYKKGKSLKNNILIASSKESKTDVYSSLIVLISTLLMIFSKNIEILKYSSNVAVLIVSIFIIKTGYEIIRENVSSLLEEDISDETRVQVENIISSNKKILKINELHLFKYGKYYKLLSNVVMDSKITLIKAHQIIDEIEVSLKKINVKYVYIHMEPDKK